MKKEFAKAGLTVFLTLLLFGAVNAQEINEPLECQVLETEGAELVQDDGNIVLENDTVLEENSTLSTDLEGYAVLMCNDGFREIPSDRQGDLHVISEKTNDMEADIPDIEEEIDIHEILNQTDRIEENLDDINQVINDGVPDQIASLVMGDSVNFHVDNTTIGIATNETGVTEVQSEKYEEPTLEIKTSEETLMQIINSENAPETFRDAYYGESITVEAYSIKNKLTFGIVNTASKIHGFINRFI